MLTQLEIRLAIIFKPGKAHTAGMSEGGGEIDLEKSR